MATQPILLRPGVNRQASQTLADGGWWDSSLVRWRDGMPEKLGGWAKFITATMTGVCRALHAWAFLSGDSCIAGGTNSHLHLTKGGTLYDVTPNESTAAEVNGIATSSGSAVVTVTTGAAHGRAVGDYVAFGAITVGGIDLSVGNDTFGGYAVTAVTSSTVFTITAQANASSTVASGGGAWTLTNRLASGAEDESPGLGWGAGGYGLGTYGTPRTVSASTLPARIWSLQNWGQGLLGVPSQAGLYYWEPDASGLVTTRAAIVTNGTAANGPPLRIGSMVVAPQERHVVLLGCADLNASTNYDPMLVRWSDVEDYSNYKASSTNSAGSFRLQEGSRIVGALNVGLVTLIWTDRALYQMRFVGLPYVYSFELAGRNCGMSGQKAAVELDGNVYWFSGSNFFVWRGSRPEILDCSLHDDVLSNLSLQQRAKVYASINAKFGEVWFWYQSSSGTEIDRVAVYVATDRIWYGHQLSRTAWVVNDDLFSNPVAAVRGGTLYQHEYGVDADGAAMGEYAEAGYLALADGTSQMFVERLLPDFRRLTGSVSLYVRFADSAMGTALGVQRLVGPKTCLPTTTSVSIHGRGSHAALRIEGGGVGSDWRLGKIAAVLAADGRR